MHSSHHRKYPADDRPQEYSYTPPSRGLDKLVSDMHCVMSMFQKLLKEQVRHLHLAMEKLQMKAGLGLGSERFLKSGLLGPQSAVHISSLILPYTQLHHRSVQVWVAQKQSFLCTLCMLCGGTCVLDLDSRISRLKDNRSSCKRSVLRPLV